MAVRKPARKSSRAGRVRALAASPAQARAHVFAPAHVKKARTEEVDPKREVNLRMPTRRAKVFSGRNRGPRRHGTGDLEGAQGQRRRIHPPRAAERHPRARRRVELGADARRRGGRVVGEYKDARCQRQQVPHRGRDGAAPRHQEPLLRHQDHQLPAGALEQGAQHRQDHVPPPVHTHLRFRHRRIRNRLLDDEVESGGGGSRGGVLPLREHELRPVPAAHLDRQRRGAEELDLHAGVSERRLLGSQHHQRLPGCTCRRRSSRRAASPMPASRRS